MRDIQPFRGEPSKYDEHGMITAEWARWAAECALAEAILDDLEADDADRGAR
jgi:hypothetical protein